MIGVKIERGADKTTVAVKINDAPITDISGAKLHLPGENAALSKDGTEISPETQNDSETIFAVEETGEYDTKDTTDDKSDIALYFVVGVLAAVLLSALIFFAKKVRQHRK